MLWVTDSGSIYLHLNLWVMLLWRQFCKVAVLCKATSLNFQVHRSQNDINSCFNPELLTIWSDYKLVSLSTSWKKPDITFYYITWKLLLWVEILKNILWEIILYCLITRMPFFLCNGKVLGLLNNIQLFTFNEVNTMI